MKLNKLFPLASLFVLALCGIANAHFGIPGHTHPGDGASLWLIAALGAAIALVIVLIAKILRSRP